VPYFQFSHETCDCGTSAASPETLGDGDPKQSSPTPPYFFAKFRTIEHNRTIEVCCYPQMGFHKFEKYLAICGNPNQVNHPTKQWPFLTHKAQRYQPTLICPNVSVGAIPEARDF